MIYRKGDIVIDSEFKNAKYIIKENNKDNPLQIKFRLLQSHVWSEGTADICYFELYTDIFGEEECNTED